MQVLGLKMTITSGLQSSYSLNTLVLDNSLRILSPIPSRIKEI